MIVCLVTMDPYVYVSPVGTPFNSVKELIEVAKKNPKTIRFGSPGVTSMGAFGYYSLHDAYPDVKFVRVPLRGHSDIVTGMLRGDVEVASGTYAGYKAQVDGGKLKPLGVASPERTWFLPNLPTLKEQGVNVNIVPNMRYVAVPKGTPMEVVKKIEAAFKAMTEDKLVIKRIKTLNQNLVFHGQKKALEFAKNQSAHFKKLIKKMGLTIKKKK
jgi:tripartite-type tricarboxylate transporter receptor subunit TctC